MYPPNAKLTRLVDATTEPLALADAKNYLRVDAGMTDDDALIADMITAARMEAEQINGRSFISTTWQLTLDYLPVSAGPSSWPGWTGALGRANPDDGSIQLPMPPLIAVQSITYIDQSGVTRSIDLGVPDFNAIVSPGTPGRIYPAYGRFFPLGQPRAAAVNIIYTAGYGPDATTVPRTVLMAIRMLTAHYYEHRSNNAEVPDAVVNLLNCTRWGSYA